MENIGGGSGRCLTPNTPLPSSVYPTEAEETTRWWRTQNIQRDGMGGCKLFLNGQTFFTLPAPNQHRNGVGACCK